MEQIGYNLLFRWFVGLGIDDPVWVPTVFSKNRDRLLDADVAAKFMAELLTHKEVRGLLSNEHFSVDGTLIEAWASMKSFQPIPAPPPDAPGADDPPVPPEPPAAEAETPSTAEPELKPMQDRNDRNAEVDFHGQHRSNATHASKTDPEARLYKKGKGKEARLCFMGHALMENRSGLIVDAETTRADGHAEREAALDHDRAVLPRRARDHPRRRQGLRHGDFVDDLRGHERGAACRGQGQGLGDRRPHHAPRRLHDSQRSASGSKRPWLGQDRRPRRQDDAARPGTGGVPVQTDDGGLQSCQVAQAARRLKPEGPGTTAEPPSPRLETDPEMEYGSAAAVISAAC